jgi:hypothetical protein
MTASRKIIAAIAAGAAALVLAGCGTAAAASSHPAAAAPASLPTADSIFTSAWQDITDIPMPPGMTGTGPGAAGVASAAYGLGGTAEVPIEQVVLVYRTPAEAIAGAAWVQGQADSLGLASQPGPGRADIIARGSTDPSSPEYTTVIAWGTQTDMTRLISQISGGNA